MKSVFLYLTSAIGMAGEVVPPGEVIQVTEAEAQNFLDRGKARLAVAADMPEGHFDGDDDASDDTTKQPATGQNKGTTK